VVEGIEYFVAPEFRYTYASNPEHLEKVGGFECAYVAWFMMRSLANR